MKKKVKRILALMLTATMLISALPLQMLAVMRDDKLKPASFSPF